MWSSGRDNEPGWPTWNSHGYDPWREARANCQIFPHRQREEATRRPWVDMRHGGLLGILLILGGSAVLPLRGLLAGDGIQALLLATVGLCWILGRRRGPAWRWLSRDTRRGAVLLVLVSATLLLTGCAETMKGLAKTMYNVDYDAMQSPPPRRP